jgi:hypothetical protein
MYQDLRRFFYQQQQQAMHMGRLRHLAFNIMHEQPLKLYHVT